MEKKDNKVGLFLYREAAKVPRVFREREESVKSNGKQDVCRLHVPSGLQTLLSTASLLPFGSPVCTFAQLSFLLKV